MNERVRIFFYYAYKVGLHVFAVAGLVLVVGFFAVRWHWTDMSGSIDPNSDRFSQISSGRQIQARGEALENEYQEDPLKAVSINSLDSQIRQLAEKKSLKVRNYCMIDIIGQYSPGTASRIIQTYQETDADVLASKMILAARLRIEEKNGENIFADCDKKDVRADDGLIGKEYLGAESKTIFPWMDNEQWNTIRKAIVKDKDAIERAASVAGIEPRLLVSCAIVEQVRLFHSQRELFKKFFEPLKILGNANKISLGIMGIKENTAVETENHLRDQSSPYYLGDGLRQALDFGDGNNDGKRYDRLTEDTHYYSYLYGALYLKQLMTQWERAGFDIKYRPEISGTLFNIGFQRSKPNPDPKVGGSNIEINGSRYTFGSLAYEFYYSGELTEVFPSIVN